MPKLIIETDLGRDPDDFFALCYLMSAGVDIDAILITPGDLDQIAIGKFLVQHLQQDIPILASQKDRTKKSSGGVHYRLLNKYKYPLSAIPDGHAEEVASIRDKDIFVIGPPTAIGQIIDECRGEPVNQITVQGGFIGYDVHGLPCERLEKFENKTTVSTFNLGGAPKQAQSLVNYPYVKERRFISKNLCHTIVYTNEVNDIVNAYDCPNESIRLLREGMSLYLENHKDGKKFHDPTAAVCHLHPEIAVWAKAKLYCVKNQWGAELDDNGDSIIVDINRDKLWECIAKGQ